MSAPAPKQADRIPNVRGPASSVCFARIGSRMLKLKQTDAKTTIIARTTFTVFDRRANENPSRVPFQTVGRAAALERVELGDAHRERDSRGRR